MGCRDGIYFRSGRINEENFFNFILLFSVIFCAVFRVMVLAIEVEIGVFCGCGRIRLGEGDRFAGFGFWRLGGFSMCSWVGVGIRFCF